MKSINIIIIILLGLLFTSCGNTSTESHSKIKIDSSTEATSIIKGELTNFSKSDIARFSISAIMGRPAKTINVIEENGLFVVSYKKKGDSKKYIYKVKIDQDKILWANIDGRWRDTEFDEKISFEETEQGLKIIQKYNDGSSDVKEFKKGD